MAEILQVNWRYAVPRSGRDRTSQEDQEKEKAKYKLRGPSVRKRLEAEDRLGRARGPRPRTPSSKMSKYRRKTANARERQRMGAINVAYDRLKDTIPLPSVGLGRQKCEKLTKINLLHIAINYIRTLQDILDTGEEGVDIVPERLILNPFRQEEEEGDEGDDEEREEEREGGTCQEDCSHSSPDSGIQEDSDTECPDWTELNSTLDIRSVPAESSASTQPHKKKKSNTSVAPVSTASNNANFKFTTNSENKVTRCKPVTLTSRSPTIGHQRKKYFLNASISQALLDTNYVSENQSEHLLNTNFHLEQDDLFNELNSSIDSFDSINDIDFCYDDPFKVF